MKKSLLFVASLLLVSCTATVCGCNSGQTDSGQSLKSQPREIIQNENELPPDDGIMPELPPDEDTLPEPPNEGCPHCKHHHKRHRPPFKDDENNNHNGEIQPPIEGKTPKSGWRKKLPDEEISQSGEDEDQNNIN